MSKSIFISCVFEDAHRIKSIEKWCAEKRLGNVAITHETEDKRQLGKDAIKQHIKNKIQGATIILVLIGQDTHNHAWIEAEVELGNSFHKEIVCMRIPQTTGPVPGLLSKKRIIAFDPDALRKVLSD